MPAIKAMRKNPHCCAVHLVSSYISCGSLACVASVSIWFRERREEQGVTISRFPYPVLPPSALFCPFVSLLPPFIVFHSLSCKSRCFTPYSDCNRECFGLVQYIKLYCKSNHSALTSAIIEAAFLPHKFTPRGKIFSVLWTTVARSELPRRSSMDGFFPTTLFDDIWPDSLCRSYGEFRQLARQTRHWHDWHSRHTCTYIMLSHSCPMM